MRTSQSDVRRFSDFVFAALMIVGCLAAFIPFSPRFPEAGLDPGWAFGLNAAVDRGFVFGKDVIFTFGPYASAYSRQYHPATDLRMLLSTGLLGAAFSVGFLILTQGRNRLLLLLATPLLLALLSSIPDPLFFSNSVVFLIVVSRLALPASHPSYLCVTSPVYFSLTLSILALGLLPLIKGSFALASFATVALSCVILILGRLSRIAAANIALFAVSISSFWVLAGQPLSLLPQFFIAQAPIISGYTDAMSSPGPVREPLFYIAATVGLGLCYAKFIRSGGIVGSALAFGVGLLLFLGFKAGFVRHDGHAFIAAGVIALTGWILFASFPTTSSAIGFVCCFLCWGLIFDRLYPTRLSFPNVWRSATSPIISSIRGLSERIADNGHFRAKYDSALASIRTGYPLPPLKGTADVYSYGQAILLANGLDWKPRSILQSYSAYTPLLVEKNAHNIDDEAPPQNILFNVQPIDGRLPSLEDGLSWPSLLTRYRAVALHDQMAILQLRSNDKPADLFTFGPVSSGTYRFGEEIAVPPAGGIQWAKFDVTPTLLGKLFALIYKPPQLKIQLRFSDNKVREFRYVAGMGRTGFVVSPLVERTDEFLALELPNRFGFLAGAIPQTVSISSDTWNEGYGRLLWNSTFSAELSQLNLSDQPDIAELLLDPVVDNHDASGRSASEASADNCWIDEINGRPVQDSKATVGHILRVHGWAGFSIKDGVAPDKTVIRLTAADGEVKQISAKITPRDDVNRYFGQPNMGKVGYTGASDVSSIPGTYNLGIEVTAGGQTRICDRKISLSITP